MQQDNFIPKFEFNMNNWMTIQPVLTQHNGSQTADIAMPSTQIFDNSYYSDPRWIQPLQTQHTTHPYELTSFEPSHGNEINISKLDPDGITSFDPSYGLGTSVSNFNQTSNPKPQDDIQNWNFEDSDLLVPLPEALLHNVDMEKLQKTNQPGLDNINQVQIQHGTTQSTISRNQSMTTNQMQVHSRDTSLQERTVKDSQISHDLVRARVIAKIKEVELKGGPKRFKPQSLMVDPRPARKNPTRNTGNNRIQKVTPTKVNNPTKAKTPRTKKLPIKKAIKSTQTYYQRDDALFQDRDFNKIYDFMKKLDTRRSESSTNHLEALQVAQQRQIWIQAWNVLMANLIKKEAIDIFTLYTRHTFQPVLKNPQASKEVQNKI